MKQYTDYSLRAHNTFGIEARCKRYVAYESVAEAQTVAALLRQAGASFLIIGGGSNLLLTADYDGTVVRSEIKGICRQGVLLRCGSGEVWDDVVTRALEEHLYGAENLSIIPGDVGASAVQNIGAYGSEVASIIDSIEAVEIATGNVVTLRAGECGYAYRYSRFKDEWRNRYLITRVTYRLSETFSPLLDYGNIRSYLEQQNITSPTADDIRQAVIAIRRAKLPEPSVLGNAGSFFMNPVVDREKYESLAKVYPDMPHYVIDADHEKIPAGWMIEQCGWKGRRMGAAGVHDKQALVLVNHGGASGADIISLCRAIQKDVAEKFGIDIKPEVNIV